jgi:amino acid transporter
MVIGAGIFKTSTLVAASVDSPAALLAAWLAGGMLSIIGGLCFAEMAAAFPDAGGEYKFLHRAYGARVALLFAWSRFAIIHSGSMALLAFVFGDYVVQLWPVALNSPACAAAVIVALVGLNLAGVRVGLSTQLGLMALVLAGLALVAAAALRLAWVDASPPPAAASGPVTVGTENWGTAMVFVFLAYGGWSDAATLSAEMRDARRGIVHALLGGLGLVTLLYLLTNLAYLRGLGLAGLAASSAPAADVVRLAFGRGGELAMVAIVATTAVSVMNASLIVGARTTYAAARDLAAAGGRATALARWHPRRGMPDAAVAALGAVALLLVGLGTLTRGGFATLVDYLAPVYWGFMCASAAALLVLRRRLPQVPRPFRVPGHPWLPLAFCAGSGWMLWASLAYVKVGALVGLAVLALGGGLLAWLTRRR